MLSSVGKAERKHFIGMKWKTHQKKSTGASAGGETASTCGVVSRTETATHHVRRGRTSKDSCNSPSTNHQCKFFPFNKIICLLHVTNSRVGLPEATAMLLFVPVGHCGWKSEKGKRSANRIQGSVIEHLLQTTCRKSSRTRNGRTASQDRETE